MTAATTITDNTWDREIASDGTFVRGATGFHNRISREPGSAHPPEAGRYHLYVLLACPWGHRTLIVRALKGLQELISVDVVHPYLTETGWSFDTDFAGATGDQVGGFSLLQEVYRQADPDYQGIITVPVLWDKLRNTIVNNESSEILRSISTQTRCVLKSTQSMPGSIRTSTTASTAVVSPAVSGLTVMLLRYYFTHSTRQKSYCQSATICVVSA